jgi:hypothetical protein
MADEKIQAAKAEV